MAVRGAVDRRWAVGGCQHTELKQTLPPSPSAEGLGETCVAPRFLGAGRADCEYMFPGMIVIGTLTPDKDCHSSVFRLPPGYGEGRQGVRAWHQTGL